jgi:hypothetical protein
VALPSAAAYGPVAFLPLLCCHKTRTRCGQPLLVLPFHGITTSEKEKKRRERGVQHVVVLLDQTAPVLCSRDSFCFGVRVRSKVSADLPYVPGIRDRSRVTTHFLEHAARQRLTTPIRQQPCWYSTSLDSWARRWLC